VVNPVRRPGEARPENPADKDRMSAGIFGKLIFGVDGYGPRAGTGF
jgi:hypothetical protein